MIAEISGPSLEARSLHLAQRVQAHNSLGRRLLVVVLDALADALLPALEVVQEEGRQMGRHEMRVMALGDGGDGNDAMELVRDARGRLDQVIIIATAEHDIAESEALCARCVNEGVKVGAILIDANCPSGGQTATAARQYAETIAIVHEPETAIEILRAIGV